MAFPSRTSMLAALLVLVLPGRFGASQALAAAGDVTATPQAVRGGELWVFRGEGPGVATITVTVNMPTSGDPLSSILVEAEDAGEVKGAFVQGSADGQRYRFLLRPQASKEPGPRGTVVSLPATVTISLAEGLHEYNVRLGREARFGGTLSASGAPSAPEALELGSEDGGDRQPAPPVERFEPAEGIEELPVSVNGFALASFTNRTTGLRPPNSRGEDVFRAENLLRLELDARTGPLEGVVRGDLLADAFANEFEAEVREGFLGLYAGPVDVRIGRQIASWGVGDQLFINDLFPKDYVSLYSGGPSGYLRLPVDAARVSLWTPFAHVDLIAIPFFRAHELPTSEEFFLFEPYPSDLPRNEVEPESTAANTEVAARLFRRVGRVELALYGYKGFSREPRIEPGPGPGAPTELAVTYPEMTAYGLSARLPLLGGVASLEGGIQDTIEDPDVSPAEHTLSARALAGYSRGLWSGFRFGVQYYAQHSSRDEFEGSAYDTLELETLTFRVEQVWSNGTWGASTFAFYNPRQVDFLIQPRLFHKTSDRMTITLGGNFFGGAKPTRLGQFDLDDNAFLSVRYDF